MKAVVGLLVLILGVSHGLETYCDCREDGAQCYGPLGGTVVLHLIDRALLTQRYKLYKSSIIILNMRNNKNLVNETRSSFNVSDGKFRLNNLIRNDSDKYKLEIQDGSSITSRVLQLTIQAPVSSVRLVSECLSKGEKRVSCSAGGGDSPQYSWTLAGHPLKDTELLSVNTKNDSITLKQHVSGVVACIVRNNVSQVSKEEHFSNCGFIFINCTSNGTQISQWVFPANNTLCIESTTSPTTTYEASTVEHLPIMAGALSALVLLLVVGVAVICAQRKKTSNQPTDEDEQELTYAEVKIKQRPGPRIQPKAEPQVEYGQVKFSKRPRQTCEPAGDECVYAKVRKGR
ncbi:uncharacterized protein LOC134859835 isoform X2 [Eleginops maclovinus]|uniref:uncharacterized protein LOC134859835 isoform X2 n=1 Tax=Eleginops maclovinus TaxID=56733 RepID=UPI003080E7D5